MVHELEAALQRIEKQIEDLKKAEEAFLLLDAHKKVFLSQLILRAEGKSHSERETRAYATTDWLNFSEGLAKSEARANEQKRLHELSLKNYDAWHLCIKVERHL